MEKYIEVEGIDFSTYAGKAASACKTKAKAILGENLLIFTLIDFITFIELNNSFSEKGIYITNENREDSYIKIIETGDEELINKLEKYLQIKDSLDVIKNKKEEYTKIITDLKMLDDKNDIESIKKIIEEYLRR